MTTAVTPRPATAAGREPAPGARRPRRPKGLSAHAFLILAVVISVFPFLWTIVMATNTTRDIYKSPPKLTPGSHLLENIRGVLDTVDFFGSMLNTIVIACATTVLVLLVDSLAAFAFAKFEFPGRKLLFGLLLVFMMLPLQLAVLPQFILMSELGWVGMLKALVWPALSNAFGIIRSMRMLPIAPSQILAIAVASVLPALPLVLFVVPLDELILRGVRTILHV